MPINDEIITLDKLNEFEKVCTYNDWEECMHLVNQSVLGEMDWYLIDGLMRDHYFVATNDQSEQIPEEFMNMVIDLFETPHTWIRFVQITEGIEYK